MDRIRIYDLMKCIALVSVFIGHSVPRDSTAHFFVYSYHLPVFFFVSGLLFKNNANGLALWRKCLTSFIVPFVYFLVISMFVRCVLLQNLSPVVEFFTAKSLYKTFFLCEPNLNHPLWFLICLGEVFLLFHLVYMKFKDAKASLMSLLAVLFSVSVAINYLKAKGILTGFLPFHIQAVPISGVFYGIGVALSSWLRKRITTISYSRGVVVLRLLLALSLFSLTLAACQIGEVGIHWGRFDLRCFPVALFGMAGCYVLACVIDRIPYVSRCLQFVGENSLVFFGLEMSVGFFSAWLIDALLRRYTGVPGFDSGAFAVVIKLLGVLAVVCPVKKVLVMIQRVLIGLCGQSVKVCGCV